MHYYLLYNEVHFRMGKKSVFILMLRRRLLYLMGGGVKGTTAFGGNRQSMLLRETQHEDGEVS